jgi:rod shape-determining protein MreC
MEHLMGRYRNVSILAAAIFLQIVGLAVQVKRRAENQSTRLIRVWSVAAITPLEKNIVRIQTGASSVWNNYLYLRGLRQQNRELQDQIQQLQLEQVRLRQDAEQARRLQALLGFKEQFIDKTTAAQVIGSSGSEQSRIVYLDKGSADGIAQDMAVISAQGVVGKVIQVFRHTAQVLLINDQTSGVGTILEQSRLQGVLKGKASGDLVLDKIMAEEDVKTGDRVLTSGGDQIFPKGLVVGTVAKVTRGQEFLTVTVRPATSLNHLEEVLVITKKEQREPAVSPAASQRAADILAQRLPSVPDKPEQPQTGAVSGAQGGALPPKTSPKAPNTAAVTTPNSAGSAAPNSPAIVSKTPSQGSARTQAVDLVRPNPIASEQPGNTSSSPKPKANAAVTESTAVQGQTKPSFGTTTQSTPSATQGRGVSATPTPTKAGGTSMNTGVSLSAGRTTGATPRSAPVDKNSTTATQQAKPLKPAPPTASKPVADTAQPVTQPDAGDVPQ